jgi:hypothetical protein
MQVGTGLGLYADSPPAHLASDSLQTILVFGLSE